MTLEIGLIYAFAAMLCWGVGDFLIQKSTRKIGDWETLFFIAVIGILMTTPFVLNDMAHLTTRNIIILGGISLLSVAAFLLDFESLKKGKLAIVEPILTIEAPAAALLAFMILGETVTLGQGILIAILLSGIIMVSLKKHHLNAKSYIEKGAFFAIGAAMLMGATNFFIGYGSRITDPILMVWFTAVVTAIACGSYLVFNNRTMGAMKDFRKHWKLILAEAIPDNGAWIFYALALNLSPIIIATAITESYVVLAAILGITISDERLLKHQKIGLVVSVLAAIVLAATV